MRSVFQLVMLALVMTLAACSGQTATQAPTIVATTSAPTTVAATSMPTAASAAKPTTQVPNAGGMITDAMGHQMTFASPPQRIVSLAPSITEMLFAVGAGDKVVGVTKYCNYPPAADALPEIGGYSASSISVEAIVNLTPDLVVAGALEQAPIVEALAKAKIPVLVFEPKNFEQVYTTLTQIGQITGTAAQAEKVVADMHTRLDAVAAKVATLPAEKRPTVFYEVFDEPLMTAGPNTFIGQMISLVGATSIFTDTGKDYPTVSAEAIIERNPDVIIGPDSHGDKLTTEALAQRPGWGELSAVKARRIYLLNGDMVSRPGPRLAEATEALATVLYPELFP